MGKSETNQPIIGKYSQNENYNLDKNLFITLIMRYLFLNYCFGIIITLIKLDLKLVVMKCLIESLLESNTVVRRVNKVEVIRRYIRMKYKINISFFALKQRIDHHLFHSEMYPSFFRG